jgi:AraC family transcriptional regulator
MNLNQAAGSKVGINSSNNLDSRRIPPAVVTDRATPMSGVEDDVRTVIRHTPFLFTRCGADFRFRFVSDAYARMLGLRPSQIIGKPIVEIIGENALKTIMPHIRKALRGQCNEYEGEINYGSVGTRRMRVIYTPERDNHGRIKGWVASMIDLSHQKMVADGPSTMRSFFYVEQNDNDPADGTAFQSPDRAEVVVSNPTVEILPADAVRRRAITSHGMMAESVQTASHARIEYSFCAPVHLLVIYEDGARRDGETFVEGLPQATLRSFAHKFTFVPAGHRYHEWHEPRGPSHIVYCYFDPKVLKIQPRTQMTDASLTPRLYFGHEWLWNTTLKLEELLEHPTSENQLYLEALGAVIMHELFHLDCHLPGGHFQIHGGLAPWQQRIAGNYIEEHLAERIELAALASLVRRSPFHFCRAFKVSFGMPPLRYRAKRRIEHSKLLLTDPGMSVTDIGLTVGFGTSSSFVTAFRRATGLTPTEYKRSLG